MYNYISGQYRWICAKNITAELRLALTVLLNELIILQLMKQEEKIFEILQFYIT